MKKVVRRGVFETNSSNVHNLCMCTKSQYDAWVAGDLIYDKCDKKLIPINNIDGDDDGQYLTYEEFSDEWHLGYDNFKQSFTTPSGDKVVAFGYYGHD